MKKQSNPLPPNAIRPMAPPPPPNPRVCGSELRLQQEKQHPIMVPYLHNRGDGVNGHYCIGRNTGKGYFEFWNEEQQKWTSAGSVFKLGKLP